MVLDGVLPVFLVIGIGFFLKRLRFTDDSFLRKADRLTYYFFFPSLLFWKIGSPSNDAHLDPSVFVAVYSAILLAWLLTFACKPLFGISNYEMGAFSQCCYRFNTYIGMAILLSAKGDFAVRLFAVLISLAIPFINLLAVSTLIWFSGGEYNGRERARLTLKAIISNPLILACMAGLVYARTGRPLPVFLDNTFRLVSAVALPLALVSVGGAIALERLQGYFKKALAASLFKVALLPLLGYATLRLFNVEGLPFWTTMLFFALPTSVSSYVLSSQMNSDPDMASAVIVLSTLLSMVSLSFAVSIIPS